MKVELPEGWQEIYADPQNWPNSDMRDCLAYTDGGKNGGGVIYYREKVNLTLKNFRYLKSWKSLKNWTDYPIIRQLIRKHEITHAIQFKVYGKMWHVDESGIMSRRGSWAWAISPVVSLLRWDWHGASSRGVINVYNKRFKNDG